MLLTCCHLQRATRSGCPADTTKAGLGPGRMLEAETASEKVTLPQVGETAARKGFPCPHICLMAEQSCPALSHQPALSHRCLEMTTSVLGCAGLQAGAELAVWKPLLSSVSCCSVHQPPSLRLLPARGVGGAPQGAPGLGCRYRYWDKSVPANPRDGEPLLCRAKPSL